MHVARLDRAADLEISRFQVDSTRTAEREYQGHRPREAWGTWRSARESFPAGTVVVPVRQPLGRLIVVLLEPRSDDGFLSWNLLDRALEERDAYPIVRVPGLPAEGCQGCARFR